VRAGLSRRVGGGELAESVVGTGAVNGGWSTLHEEADTDRFGRLFFGCSGENRASRVRGNATVAPVHHPDGQRHQLFDFPIEGTWRQHCGAHLRESAIYLWNHLSQSTALRIEVIEYVLIVLDHVTNQQLRRLDNCRPATDSGYP
jgi:hypothetical protein